VKLRVLALDVDGTIAVGGRLDGDVADAIREARHAGVMTVLVSGRMLADIQGVLPALDLASRVPSSPRVRWGRRGSRKIGAT
jgi:hydroxymethylpyrimidine pyrophosphatase-like HAD family hydrolase